MLEMPEIESLRRLLAGRIIGRTITRIDIVAISALKTVDPGPQALCQEPIRAVERYGKFLDVDAGVAHLVIHLARAGWLRWSQELPRTPPRPGKGPLAARVHLDDGSGFDLTEAGTQKKLAIHIVSDPQLIDQVRTLGPDPAAESFDRAQLSAVLHSAGRAHLKGVLRDQRMLAGIGNAYSDEILHAAKLSPFKSANSLTPDEIDELFTAIKAVLADALRRCEGVAASDLRTERKVAMAVHGRTGRPCPVCGDTICQVCYADLSLQYCPTCQTGGTKLKDRRMSRLLK